MIVFVVYDAVSESRKLRVLSITDDCTQHCLRIEVDTSLSGEWAIWVLDQFIEVYGKLEVLLKDDGLELTSKKLYLWAYRKELRIQFIESGNPSQNGLIESFNGTTGTERPNKPGFLILGEARQIIEQ